MPNNNQIIKDAVATSTLTAGLLNPEQSKKFIVQTMEKLTIGQLVRHEMRTATTGELDKLAVGSELLRPKSENTPYDELQQVITSKVPYATTAIRLDYEITGETLRQNIEGMSFEQNVTNNMTGQLARDLENLYLNGDTASVKTPTSFYRVNDGWIKQIENGGHVVDATGQDYSVDLFYNTIKTLPNKYNSGNLKWIMSPFNKQSWEQALVNKAINAGGNVPESIYNSPGGIPIQVVPFMPNDKIILTDPKNLIVVNTYTMQIKKDNTSKDVIKRDVVYYVIHLDFDTIVEELDATAIIENIS